MSINKIMLAKLIASVLAIGLVSCAGKAKQPQAEATPPKTTFPCQVHDSDDWFETRGIASGSRAQVDAVRRLALTYAQDEIRQRMEHIFKGMITPFLEGIGGNQGTDIRRLTTIEGDQIIKGIIPSAEVTCEEYSEVNEKGHIEAYIAVRISKKKAADSFFDMVEDMVSKDEEMRIRFAEGNYRKRMENELK